VTRERKPGANNDYLKRNIEYPVLRKGGDHGGADTALFGCEGRSPGIPFL
jgi:hypothetical protein